MEKVRKVGKRAAACLMAMAVILTGINWSWIPANAETLTSEKPDVGDGSETSPYEIDEASELLWFAEKVNGGDTAIHGVLTADIDMNPGYTFADDGTYTTGADAGELVTWTPIGRSATSYAGQFDGNGYSVSGIYFNDTTTAGAGLFGYVNGAIISNVGVKNSYIECKYDGGGICGYSKGGGTYLNCYNEATISGNTTIGGIVGWGNSADVIVTNCYNAGDIKAKSSYDDMFGGIVGYIGTITNCHNYGTVYYQNKISSHYITYPSTSSVVTNCYYLASSEADSFDGSTYKAAEQFASGEIAYLLQSAQMDSELVWGQLIGQEAYPVLNGQEVYNVENCNGGAYSNVSTASAHLYNDGRCNVCGTYEPKKPDAGSGTSSVPYEIDEAAELFWFTNAVNGGSSSICGVLTADINLNPGYTFAEDGTYTMDDSAGELVCWTPIGNSSKYYKGKFDGRNHTVSGIYFNDSASSYVGLFGYINNASILNVGVINSYIQGNQYVSGICGYFYGYSGGTISNCYNAATVVGSQYVGGMCAYGDSCLTISNCYNIGIVEGTGTYSRVGGISGYSGDIINCHNMGEITGNSYAGGINGCYGTISQSYNEGKVTVADSYAGGISGTTNGTVTQCYNSGNITGKFEIGGISGGYGTITQCYNNGDIAGDSYIGGISGTSGTITNCYNIGPITGVYYTGGISGRNGTITNCYNIGEVVGEYYTTSVGYGATASNSFYLADSETDSLDGTTFATKEQFASGEIAYLLQAAQTDSELVWGQLLGVDAYPVFSEDEVYNVENCANGQYSNVNIVGVHNFIDERCCLCGKYENECGFVLSGYTLSLTGNIAVNFHTRLSEELLNDSTAYMQFTYADGEISKVYVSEATEKVMDGVTYYIFTCEVQAPEMTDKFTAKMISQSGESKEYTYSVKEYANYILEHITDSEDYEKAAPMVRAMLNYGGYSQLQFNHNTDALANEGLYTAETESDPVLTETVTISDEYSLPVPSEDIGLQYYGSSLLLNSETTIRHYFTITGDEDIAAIREKYTFVLADETVLTPTLYKGMVCVDIKNINAAELDDIFSITVTNESEETISLSYSAFSYAKYVLEYSLARENLVNVIKAMYLYNAAANTYFG